MWTAKESARRYAELGYPVFPCVPGRNQPLTGRGFLEATTETSQIEAWRAKYPKVNVGIPATGLVVIEVDGHDNPWLADGPDRIAELATGARRAEAGRPGDRVRRTDAVAAN